MKMLEYETANPGADFDELEKQHFNPEIHTSRPPTIIALPSSAQPDVQKDGEASAEADPSDSNGIVTGPGTHGTGKGRQRRMSVLKGGRREAGFSPAEAARKGTEDLTTDVYDAAPGAERGT